MSMLASLQFGDNGAHLYSSEYLVAECNCHFLRRYNHFRPEGIARCDKITVKVVAPGKNDLGLYEWYANGYVQSGRLIVNLAPTGEIDENPKEILFEDAHCLSLEEVYDKDAHYRRMLILEIVSEKITVDSVEFRNRKD
ncbi:MAG: type VI secretion system tube protein TssD [Bacteroidia bacterium]|nr:type VI secretion system tube protein TssD [Bacteroidia bacterium]